MELLQLTVFVALCAVALSWVARHFNFPYPIALVIGGGALGFIPLVPQVAFDPELILVLVLPTSCIRRRRSPPGAISR